MSEFIKEMRLLFIIAIIMLLYAAYKGKPNNTKPHNNYIIVCKDGLQYEMRNNKPFPLLNTDGTQAKCDTIH